MDDRHSNQYNLLHRFETRQMAIREILVYPDSRLRQVSKPVTEFDQGLKDLVRDMAETMYDAPGIGLAAIQVNVPLRVML